MPRDGTATRERILTAAQQLMTDQGYAATSVDEVIAASSSSKGAFFHHFQSKADLAGQLIDRYVRDDLDFLEAGLAAVSDIADPIDRVIGFLRYYEDRGDELMAEHSGCLYATVLAELEFSGSDINKAVARATVMWREAVVELLEPAFAARRSTTDVDLDALADHLYTTFEGAYILCRTLEDKTAMRAQLKVMRQLVEALLRGEGGA